FWLKHLDHLIDHAFDDVLAHEGLHRRDWQTLQLIAQAPSTAQQITDALPPFIGTDRPSVVAGLDVPAAGDWPMVDASQQSSLTRDGAAANARLSERVGLLRATTVAGISEAEYRATIDVLTRMADNLMKAT